MGQLVDGVWRTEEIDTPSKDGRFERRPSVFRNWITPDGAPGPSGEGGFEAEKGRYHLYVSHACPWAHRTLIFRRLKGLDGHIGVSVVHPFLGEEGWSLDTGFDGATGDRAGSRAYLREVYQEADPKADTKVTVPVLWDLKRQTIVSNESAEIIRMLNSAFDELTGNRDDYYPEALRDEIDAVNERVYETVNNGVYRAGFARSQAAHEEAVGALFETLDWIEGRLRRHRYLVSDRITEADWRLFTTLARFDPVYVTHFKCNIRKLAEYPALSGYFRELYQWPGVRETVRVDHIKHHYFASHRSLNPRGIVPVGPRLDWDAPHGRGGKAMM